MGKFNRKKTPIQIPRNKRIADLTAENDHFLDNTFVETIEYQNLSDQTDSRCLVIGRTGTGKSALIRRFESTRPDHTIRVDPKHLALNFITDSRVAQLAESFGVRLEPLYTELWKHVIVTEIIRFRYDSNGIKWTSFMDGLKRSDAKKPALEYLEEYKDQFWCKTDEVVKQKVQETEDRVGDGMEAGLSSSVANVSVSTESTTKQRTETTTTETERFKSLVGTHQLSTLDMVLELLADEIRDSGGEIYVVIDDLDENWVDRSIYRQLVMALFHTVKDLARRPGIKVIVAVRTNILRNLDFNTPDSGQREKYDSLSVRLAWSKDELVNLLDQKANHLLTELGQKTGGTLETLLPGSPRDGQRAIDYVLEHTLMRPRDAIDLLNRALEPGSSDAVITWENLTKGVSSYSQSRLEAVVDEWQFVYPELGDWFDRFSEVNPSLKRSELGEIFSEIALDFEDLPQSITSQLCADFYKHLDETQAWKTSFKEILEVLYEVGFLGINVDENSPGYIYSYQSPEYASERRSIPDNGRFKIHRAFHSALGISSRNRQKQPT